MAKRRLTVMPTLGFLTEGLFNAGVCADLPISAIRIDSRRVEPGDLFIAQDGHHTSGTNFINHAIQRGAVAVLAEAGTGIHPASVPVPVYPVTDLRSKTGQIAARFYGDPSRDMNIVGITGTNGKTSVAYYLAQALSENNAQPVGIIGTLGHGVLDNLTPAANTTPDVITINQLLSGFLSRGIHDAVMEVSSHALEQERVNNICFTSAVFTNLSRDHLDYHADMSVYGRAKKRLFAAKGLKNAVINTDDLFGQELAGELENHLNVISYGIQDEHFRGNKPKASVTASIKHQGIDSLVLDISSPWGRADLQARLSGRFNAYNLLAALVVLCLRGLSFDTALDSLSRVRTVPGRMEFFGNKATAKIFVDYSHTPDALQQALQSLRELCQGKLICVFGCGGDRDRGKRPEMGKIAEQYADRVILTSDNPRNEPSDQIIRDISAGMQGTVPVEIQADRALAIRSAIASSTPQDVVLIAGKGHETYQEIGSKRLPFSDRQLVRNILEGQG